MRIVLLLAISAAALWAQSAAPDVTAPAPGVHVSLTFPKHPVVAAEFGTLAKDITVAELTACNDMAETVDLSQPRLIQALHSKGIEALSRNSSIAVIGAGQSQSRKYVLAKYSEIALNIVSGLALSKAMTLSPSLGNALPGVQAIMQIVVPQLETAVSDHAYLSFDVAALPAVMQLAPLQCSAGIVLISGAQPKQPVDLTITGSTGK